MKHGGMIGLNSFSLLVCFDVCLQMICVFRRLDTPRLCPQITSEAVTGRCSRSVRSMFCFVLDRRTKKKAALLTAADRFRKR